MTHRARHVKPVRLRLGDSGDHIPDTEAGAEAGVPASDPSHSVTMPSPTLAPLPLIRMRAGSGSS